jgi:hypothetical protein
MLLLAAMIGCIVIAMKAPAPTNGKAQQAEIEQVKEEIRIKIVANSKESAETNGEIQKVPSAGGELGETS